MKNTIHSPINQHYPEELITAVTACMKKTIGFFRDRLVTIYLTGLEVLYILYK